MLSRFEVPKSDPSLHPSFTKNADYLCGIWNQNSRLRPTLRSTLRLRVRDKFLYSRRYMRSRHDYDDKFLYSRSNMRSRHDYDDQYARGVVVAMKSKLVTLLACLVAS